MSDIRFAKLELEDSQGNGSTTTNVFGTPFYLPAIEVALNPKPKPLNRSDEQRGIDGLQLLAQNEYEPEGAIEMRGYAHYLGALMMLLHGDVTTTAGNGVITDPDGNTIPAGAYRHEFVKLAGPTPKSARLTTSYGLEWVQARGLTLKSLGFEIQEDGVKAKAEAMANYMSRLTSDPGDSPSYEAFSILPWRRRNMVVTWPLGSEEIESIEFSLDQDLEYVFSMSDTANAGFPSRTERANSYEGFLALTGKLTRRQFDEADWDALISAEAFELSVMMESEQNIGATNYPYRMWVQTGSAQISDGELEGLKNQPRHQMELDWQAGYNEDDSYDFKVTIVNGTSAYE